MTYLERKKKRLARRNTLLRTGILLWALAGASVILAHMDSTERESQTTELKVIQASAARQGGLLNSQTQTNCQSGQSCYSSFTRSNSQPIVLTVPKRTGASCGNVVRSDGGPTQLTWNVANSQ